jgi:prenyltransferase beta subunit
MSFRLHMVQVIQLAPEVLGESAELVRAFVLKQIHREGGFCDRNHQSDLYYSVFGIELTQALKINWDSALTLRWLLSFESKLEELDLVHLSSWFRCMANLNPDYLKQPHLTVYWQDLLERFRHSEGGYCASHHLNHPNLYSALLSAASYQEWNAIPPDWPSLLSYIDGLQHREGGWKNDGINPLPAVPATSAVISLYNSFNLEPPEESLQWLKKQYMGSFKAFEQAPIPDLLSTAVALHALHTEDLFLNEHSEVLLDYIDSLWTNKGGFHGHWADHDLDVEYTYYGMLALGHLYQR